MISMNDVHTLKVMALCAFSVSTLQAQGHHSLNIADPERHPYVDPVGGREDRLNTGATVNESRVYSFYQRQADYYMAQERQPALVPAFPGLDAGLHGHWGKHNQNQHRDDRWNEIDMGSVWGQTIRSGAFAAGKAVAVKLDSDSALATCFDPETLRYPLVWRDGFINFDSFRWGTSRGATPEGPVWFEAATKTSAWTRGNRSSASEYLGYYRYEDRVVFSYRIDGKWILDSPARGGGDEPVFVRTLSFPDGFEGGELSIGTIPDGLFIAVGVEGEASAGRIEVIDGESFVNIPRIEKARTIAIAIGESESTIRSAALDASGEDLTAFVSGGPLRWPDSLEVEGIMSSREDLPYVVDTIPIPEETGFDSVMQLTSVGFLDDGTALVATLAGELWTVSGLTDSLERVRWKRFAAGLHQPIGIHIDSDGIFVMERGQITRVNDLNGDGEADFFESYANNIPGRDKSHTHSFGLVRSADGSFYFANWKDIYRTDPNGATDYFAYGVRNCMGVGTGANGSILFGPQEGTFTPASMVIEVQANEFYGHEGDRPSDTIAPPLCFVPRGIDNSTGGFLHANDDRWGPINDHTIGLSYGYSTHYLVLRDDATERSQGAVVPLDGDFQSGVMRGAMGPHDGQLYLTGIDGWGDYSVTDGCFQRVRYTGQPFRKPIGFRVHSNGLRIDFPVELDAASSTKTRNFFVQQWNYEYSKQYGSPEYSKKIPHSLGHDTLAVRSVRLLNSGRSLFVEIPEIEAVMQMHVRMHLVDADGVSFKTDLFPSIVELGDRFEAPELAPPVVGKDSQIELRVRRLEGSGALHTMSGTIVEGERTIDLDCSGALKFSATLIEARAGEALKLVFKNSDIMPHNAVFVTQGNLQKVGELAFSMLNDPQAIDKHYTPEVPEVIAGTHVVQPGGSHTLHFVAPSEPGDHHFVCTFPGHWMTMNGIFRVTGL